MDVSIEEFYKEVREYQDDSDPYINVFIDCLVASCNYDSFYKVMVKEGIKSKTKGKSNNRKGLATISSESKHEEKLPDVADSKYSGDDDYRGDKKTSYK